MKVRGIQDSSAIVLSRLGSGAASLDSSGLDLDVLNWC